MPKKTLGVQMTPDEVWSVRLSSGWRRSVIDGVTRTARQAIAPALEVPGGDGALASVSAAVGSDAVFCREIQLPFSDTRRVAQAAPLEAEESLPLPLEELVCDVQLVEKRSGGSKVMVFASPISRVSRLMDDLQARGITPDALDVEALALAAVAARAVGAHEDAVVVDVARPICQGVLVSRGIARAIRVFSATAADPALIEEVSSFLRGSVSGFSPACLFLTGPEASTIDSQVWARDLSLQVRMLPFSALGVQAASPDLATWPGWAIPLGLALRGLERGQTSQVNLLRGPFAPSKGAAPWRQVALAVCAYAAVLSALWGAAVWGEARQLDAKRKELERFIRTTFQQALPDVRSIVSEADQLRTRVTDLEEQNRTLAGLVDPQQSLLRVLRDISAKISREGEVEFRDLSIDADKVRIEGSANSYRASDRVKSEVMAASARFASVSSDSKSGTKPGEVLFTLSVGLGTKR